MPVCWCAVAVVCPKMRLTLLNGSTAWNAGALPVGHTAKQSSTGVTSHNHPPLAATMQMSITDISIHHGHSCTMIQHGHSYRNVKLPQSSISLAAGMAPKGSSSPCSNCCAAARARLVSCAAQTQPCRTALRAAGHLMSLFKAIYQLEDKSSTSAA